MDKKTIIRFLGILTAVFLAGLAGGLARPSTAYYVRYTLRASMLATAGLTSGFMAGRALASITSGVVGDFSKKIRWILAGAPMLGVSLLVYTIPSIRDPKTILLLQGLWGLLAGFAWPSTQILTAYLVREQSGTALSIYFAMGTAGMATGNKLFGILSLTYAQMIRWSSFVMLASGVILLVSVAGIETPEARGRKLAKSVSKAARNPLVAWILFSAFVIGILTGLLKEYFYVYSKEQYGVTRDMLGNLLLYAGIAGIIAGLAAGRASDKRGVAAALIGVLLMSGLGGLLLGAPLGLIVLGLGYILASAGTRASMPLTRNATVVKGAGGGTIVGFSNAVNSLGMIIGPLIAGGLYRISGWGPRASFIMAGLLVIADAVLYIILSRRR